MTAMKLTPADAPTLPASKGGYGTPAVAAVGEASMRGREKSVVAREEVLHTREKTANERDNVAVVREDGIRQRESDSSANENVVLEARAMMAGYEKHMARLQQANERLVVATVEAQVLAEEVQKAKDQMGHMAHHDFLTGLSNRILLNERLSQAIALASRHGKKLAILFIDLDRFKTINDSLGHAVGDALLQAVAQRLGSSVRVSDTVSRHGGDEFVALLSEVTDENAVAIAAENICQAIRIPYEIAEHELHIGATIGVSMYPDDGEDPETLIRNADAAMYYAKDRRRGTYHFFKREMNERALERQKTECELQQAIGRKEFELFYQAQVDLDSGKILGAEALVRWRHPVRGLLLPDEFIHIAEECGAIVPIGRWILFDACRQMQTWLDSGLEAGVLAVNISALEFAKDDFLENLSAVLHDTGLAPHHLELELTESLLMENAESTLIMLRELKSMGIRIAVDDFGTGYSSLSYLQRFPVDTLKIDQSFIAGIGSRGDDDILVSSVISLGRNLRHRVIAEGIETPEQLEFLRGHQGTEGQGYFLGEPVTADEFSNILEIGIPLNIRSTAGIRPNVSPP